MKSLVLLLLICIVSCSKKDNDLANITSIDQLNGTWEWESTCGGITGECANTSNAHYAAIEFTTDGKYIERHNDTIYLQTDYNLIKTNNTSGKLILDNNRYQSSVSVVNNQLEIVRGDLIDTYSKTR